MDILLVSFIVFIIVMFIMIFKRNSKAYHDAEKVYARQEESLQILQNIATKIEETNRLLVEIASKK